MFRFELGSSRAVRTALGIVLAGAMVVGCVGPREGAAPGGARTKNSGFNVIATMFNDAQVVSLQNLRLTNTKGAIGYPLRVNFAGIDPGFDDV